MDRGTETDINIRSLYICVKDMDRAIDFYEGFFGMPVTERDSIYSVFEVNGFRFGLFAFEKKGEEHIFGSNCLPSVNVDCANSLKKKIQGLELCFPLTRIGKNWVAEFVDPEGNHIEITAPADV